MNPTWKVEGNNKYGTQVWYNNDTSRVGHFYYSMKKVKTNYGQFEYEYNYFYLSYPDTSLIMSYIGEDKKWINTFMISKKDTILYSKEIGYSEALSLIKNKDLNWRKYFPPNHGTY